MMAGLFAFWLGLEIYRLVALTYFILCNNSKCVSFIKSSSATPLREGLKQPAGTRRAWMRTAARDAFMHRGGSEGGVRWG
jgi:hypothetical protein